MTCYNKQPITIYQGFGTRWEEQDLLKVTFNSEVDIDGFGAEFYIGNIKKTYQNIQEGFGINLTAQETATLPLGPNTGSLVIIDTENNKRPFSTELPFMVKDWADGDIKLDRFDLTIDAKIQDNLLTINIESARAGDVEPIIDKKISEHNSSEQAHPYIQGLISSEEEARIAADGVLQDNIDAEETRAKGAEDALDDKIEAETTRAEGAEGTLQNNIDAEETARKVADKTLQDNIDIVSASIKDGTLTIQKNGTTVQTFSANQNSNVTANLIIPTKTSDITNDSDFATNSGVSTAISNHNTSESAHSYIQGLISAEEIRASTNEGLLDEALTAEIENRKAQEAKLTGAIEQEVANRKAADGTLTNLTTDAKTNLVSAINEVDSHADTNASNIGTLSNLTTEAKGNLVSAINEVDSHADTNASNIGTLSNLTTDSKTNLVVAINEVDSHADTNASNISGIQGLIPQEATTSNQLADKEFVNSSIATNTANFIGTFDSVSALNSYSGTVTNNDYAFVINGVVKDNGNDWATFSDLDDYNKSLLTNFDYAWVINGSKFDLYRFDIIEQDWVLRVSDTTKEAVTLNTAYNRYKATVSGNVVTWDFEYTLNNSSFTAAQWTAINSGATPALIDQITTNKNNISTNATAISNEVRDRETADTVQQNAIIANYNAIVSNTNDIGTLSTLTTTAKTNLVSAINELNAGKVNANTAIGAGTKCKITYDSKGLVTAGADLEATDIPSLTLSKISDVTATANEVNVLDGITASTAELNILDGVTASTSEINVLDGITATTTELNYTDGVTSNIQTQLDGKVPTTRTINNKALSSNITLSYSDVGAVEANTAITGATKCKITYDSKGLVTAGADLQASDIPSLTLSKISDVTATASEVNVLDGITATTTELNYTDGVTSNIQTQLNGKQETLVSGTNIKTINSNSLLGSGDIVIDSLPAQSGQSGKFLTTNGTSASWADALVNTATGLYSLTLLGTPTDKSYSINIGKESAATNQGVAIGSQASITGWNDIALGVGAKTNAVGGNNVYQIGCGTNTESYTLSVGFYIDSASEYRNWKMIDGQTGIIPQARLASGGSNGQVLTTNGTTASWTTLDALPSQTGQSGKFLTTNGTDASWGTIPSDSTKANTSLSNLDLTGQAVIDGKVDLNASNLSTAGKSLISGLGLPSHTYDDLTLGASDASYQAPANGWFVLNKEATGGGQYINMRNNSNGIQFGISSVGAYQQLCEVLPCLKGDSVVVGYNAAGTIHVFRFVYAEGDKNV